MKTANIEDEKYLMNVSNTSKNKVFAAKNATVRAGNKFIKKRKRKEPISPLNY